MNYVDQPRLFFFGDFQSSLAFVNYGISYLDSPKFQKGISRMDRQTGSNRLLAFYGIEPCRHLIGRVEC